MNANCLMSFLKNYNRGREKSHARADAPGAALAPESDSRAGALAERRPIESELVSKLKRYGNNRR